MCEYHYKNIDGPYQTPDRHKSTRYFVIRLGYTIHCFTGKKYIDDNIDSYKDIKANVKFKPDKLGRNPICTAIEFLESKNDWVKIGSRSSDREALSDSLEELIRPFCNVGKCGSFFAPILGKIVVQGNEAGLNICEIDRTPHNNKIRLNPKKYVQMSLF